MNGRGDPHEKRGRGSNQYRDKPPTPPSAEPPPHRPDLERQAADEPMVADDLLAPWPTPAVTEFCDQDERVSRVPADPEFARQTLDELIDEECVHVMYAAQRESWGMAQDLSYTAARKSVEALLLAQGWKIGSAPGGHVAAGEVVSRWLGDAPNPGPRIAQIFRASRVPRHSHEYPDPRDPTRDARDLRAMALDNIRLMNLARQSLGMSIRNERIPTAANIDAFDPHAP